MHLASYKLHSVQPEVGESRTVGQHNGYKYFISICLIKQHLQISAPCHILRGAAMKATSPFTEETVCKSLCEKVLL